MSEREASDTVMADIGYEMTLASSVWLECDEGGSEVCDSCEKYVQRKENELRKGESQERKKKKIKKGRRNEEKKESRKRR